MSDEPEKVDLETPDLAAEKRAAFEELFPGVLADGVLDATRLGELLDTDVTAPAEGRERYGLMWAGKHEAVQSLLTPSRGTLVPDLENSTHFDNAENVFIEGDNLEVLKLLQKSYNDKVKLIYIDPPYNTTNDFVYNDDFSDGLQAYLEYTGQVDDQGIRASSDAEISGRRHSRWLSMMYPRLVLARNLLRQDGVFAASIDDNEAANLRAMLDEIFGAENFVAQVVVQANKGGRDYLPLAQTHEYLMVYARNYAEVDIHGLSRDAAELPLADQAGRYQARELRNRNPRFNRANRPNLFYPFYADPTNVDEHGYASVSLEATERHTVQVLPRNSAGADSCWRWGVAKSTDAIVNDDPVASQVVAKQARTGKWNVYEKHRPTSQKAKTLWDETEVRTEAGTREIRRLFGSSVFDHPKSVFLLRKLISIVTVPGGDEVVLDFFAGSGTAAHACMELNAADEGSRRCISVNLPEPIEEGTDAYSAGYREVSDITVQRLRYAMDECRGADRLGLRFLRLDRSKFREAVELDGELDLEESTLASEEPDWEAVAAEVLLKEGVTLDQPWERHELVEGQIVVFDGVAVVLTLHLDDEVVTKAHDLHPRVVVFLEDGFAGKDSLKANAVSSAKALGITTKTV